MKRLWISGLQLKVDAIKRQPRYSTLGRHCHLPEAPRPGLDLALLNEKIGRC